MPTETSIAAGKQGGRAVRTPASAGAGSYSRLISELRKEIEQGLSRIKRFAESQKVTTHWNIGRLISLQLAEQTRSITSQEFYENLTNDLSINVRTLQQCVQFFKTYPKLNRGLPLTWLHYCYLMRIDSESERLRWQKRIIKEEISAKEFYVLWMQKRRQAVLIAPPAAPQEIVRGCLYTYRIIKVNYAQDAPGGFMVDCGFDIRIIPPPGRAVLDNTLIVESRKEEGRYFLISSKRTKPQIYTYQAQVERVVDGDTLLVNIDAGFGIYNRQYLRLRGIDAPEMNTVKGAQSKRFVQDQLKLCPFVVIKTYWTDQYSRYLADVFYEPDEPDAFAVAEKGRLLNSDLVQMGFAEGWKGADKVTATSFCEVAVTLSKRKL